MDDNDDKDYIPKGNSDTTGNIKLKQADYRWHRDSIEKTYKSYLLYSREQAIERDRETCSLSHRCFDFFRSCNTRLSLAGLLAFESTLREGRSGQVKLKREKEDRRAIKRKESEFYLGEVDGVAKWVGRSKF